MHPKYQAFCAGAPDLPIFLYDWYLDVVCAGAGGTWDAVAVEKGGHVVAVWPFFLKKKCGMTYVAMPPLTRFMGPYLLPEYRNARHETALLEALLGQLPPLAAYEQDCPYTLTNWLPFYWQGFRQTTRYSYRLPLHDLKAVWAGLAADYRNQKIPKAREQVIVSDTDDLEAFFEVHNRSYRRQGLAAPVSLDFLKKLDAALLARQSRRILTAADRQTGALHSVAYLVWDRRSAYYLMAGDDPALRTSGAGILLAWEAIRYAAETLHLDTFDFAGSMIQPIERVRRQFGAQQTPYFRLQKEWSPLFRWGKWLKNR